MKIKTPFTREAFVLAVLVPATFLLYAPSFGNGLVNWDDLKSILLNPEVRSLSWSGLGEMFVSFRGHLYKPLVTLSFALEERFFGLKSVHVVNSTLHASNVLLAWFWLKRLKIPSPQIFFVAATFAVHPMVAQSVEWASERKDLLFVLFYLSALIQYARYRDNGRFLHYGMCLFFFVLACLSKAVAITLPAVLLLMDRFFPPSGGRKIPPASYAPFWVLAALFVVLAVKAGAVAVKHAFDFDVNLALASHAVFWYWQNLLWPVHVSAYHPPPPHVTPWVLSTAVFAWAAALSLLAWSRKRLPLVGFGLSFFLVTISPNIQLIPSVGAVLVMDHYVYLPSLGFFLVLSVFLKNPRWTGLATAALWLAWLSVLTWNSHATWQNSISLWSDVIRRYPAAQTAYFNRAGAYQQLEKYEEALADYERAKKLNPADEEVWLNEAAAYARLGRRDDAVRSYRRTLQINPRRAEAYNNLGLIELAEGDRDRAFEYFSKAVELNPSLWEPHVSLGTFYADRGDWGKAASYFQKALACESFPEVVHLYAGTAFGALGRLSEAERQFLKFVRRNPTSVPGLKSLGGTYLNMDRMKEALTPLKKAYELAPSDPEIKKLLRIALNQGSSS